MEVVNISQTELDAIVERVVRTGEEVIVGKEGTPLAKLIPYRPPHPANRLDVFAGQIQMPEDFDHWPAEEARALGIGDCGWRRCACCWMPTPCCGPRAILPN